MIAIQPITDSFLNLLRAQHQADSTNAPEIYDGDSEPGVRNTPYIVVYQVSGGGFSGPPLTAPDDDTELAFQIDGVGGSRGSAQWARDWACRVVVGRNPDGSFLFPLTLPDGQVDCDRLLEETPGGVDREGVPPNALYTASQRVRIAVTTE